MIRQDKLSASTTKVHHVRNKGAARCQARAGASGTRGAWPVCARKRAKVASDSATADVLRSG